MDERIRVTIALLMEESRTDHVLDLLKAAHDLTEREYKCYVTNKEEARMHLICEEIKNEGGAKYSFRVRCRNVGLEPIMFLTKEQGALVKRDSQKRECAFMKLNCMDAT